MSERNTATPDTNNLEETLAPDITASLTQTASDSAETETSAAVFEIIHKAESRGSFTQIVGPHAVQIAGRYREPTAGALALMLDVEAPIGVWVEDPAAGRSGVCLWTGTDLYSVVLGENGKWEHFRTPNGLAAVRDSWVTGERSRYRVPHGPLMRRIDEAAELALEWGFPELITFRPSRPATPEPSVTKRPRAVSTTRTAPLAEVTKTPAAKATTRVTSDSAVSVEPKKTRVAKTSRTPRKRKEAEPATPPPLCPRCFTVLANTGVCGFCD